MFSGARCSTGVTVSYVHYAHYIVYRTRLYLQKMWMKWEIAERCESGWWLFTTSEEQFLQLTPYYRSWFFFEVFFAFFVSRHLKVGKSSCLNFILNFVLDTDVLPELQSFWTSWNWIAVIMAAVASPSLFPFLCTQQSQSSFVCCVGSYLSAMGHNCLCCQYPNLQPFVSLVH